VTSAEAVNITGVKSSSENEKANHSAGDEKSRASSPTPGHHKPQTQISLDDVVHPFDAETIRHIKRWLRIAIIFFIVNVVVTCILWPLPLYRNYIFTKTFFGGWVTMALIWHFAAILAVIVYPVWDGRHDIATAFRGVANELKRGK
jgi:hypothetical protein